MPQQNKLTGALRNINTTLNNDEIIRPTNCAIAEFFISTLAWK